MVLAAAVRVGRGRGCRTGCCGGSPGRRCWSSVGAARRSPSPWASRSTATRTGWRSARSGSSRPSWPSSRVILWCAHVYATQGAAARRLAAHADPGACRSWALVDRAGRARPRPRHRAGAAGDRARACSGWSGAPTKMFVGVDPGRRRSARSRLAASLAGADGAAHQLRRPVRDVPGRRAGRPRTASSRCRAAASSARASAPASRSGATLPAAHTDFIFAVLGEELGLVGTLLVLGLFLTLAYAGFRVARAHHGPLRPLPGRRHHGLADRADDDQRRHGARAAARSSASRCRWSPTAARRCCRRWSPLGLLISFARHEPGDAGRAARERRAAAAGGRRGPRRCSRATRPRRGGGAGEGADGRRRHGRPHLAAARDRRRPAPPRPRRSRSPRSAPRAASRSGWCPRPATRSSWSRRCRCRAGRRPTCSGVPGRLRARRHGRARGRSTGSDPTSSSASAATSRCPPTSRPASRRLPIVVHEGNALPGIANKLGRPVHRRTSPPASRTPRCGTRATSACRSGG